ncbi:MAG: hypothetical protein AAGC71_17395 [Pseudomonadota bacterium]
MSVIRVHRLMLVLVALSLGGCVSLPPELRDEFEPAPAADNHFVTEATENDR